MQVSATLIAAQQAAREARTRLQVPQAQTQAQAPQFAAALEKTTGVSGAFAPLPLKKGQVMKTPVFVVYTLRDGLICRIKVARSGQPTVEG